MALVPCRNHTISATVSSTLPEVRFLFVMLWCGRSCRLDDAVIRTSLGMWLVGTITPAILIRIKAASSGAACSMGVKPEGLGRQGSYVAQGCSLEATLPRKPTCTWVLCQLANLQLTEWWVHPVRCPIRLHAARHGSQEILESAVRGSALESTNPTGYRLSGIWERK